MKRLRSIDLLAAFHVAGAIIPCLIPLPLPLRPLAFAVLWLIFLWERGTRLPRRAAHWTEKEPETRWSRPLPSWVVWLLRLDMPVLAGEAMTIRRRLALVAGAEGYALRATSEQPLAWWESLQAIGIVVLAFLPMSGLFLPTFTQVMATTVGPALIWLLLRRLAFQRYLREEVAALPVGVTLLPEPAAKLFASYLPQENVPAFARRTWSGQQEIYFDAWLQVPGQVLQVLLLHEQGHIALGHTTRSLALLSCQLGAVVAGLLAVVCIPQVLDRPADPFLMLCFLVWIMLVLAPFLGRLLWQGRWEQEADQWAAAHLGAGAIEAARLYLRRCYPLQGATLW